MILDKLSATSKYLSPKFIAFINHAFWWQLKRKLNEFNCGWKSVAVKLHSSWFRLGFFFLSALRFFDILWALEINEKIICNLIRNNLIRLQRLNLHLRHIFFSLWLFFFLFVFLAPKENTWAKNYVLQNVPHEVNRPTNFIFASRHLLILQFQIRNWKSVFNGFIVDFGDFTLVSPPGIKFSPLKGNRNLFRVFIDSWQDFSCGGLVKKKEKKKSMKETKSQNCTKSSRWKLDKLKLNRTTVLIVWKIISRLWFRKKRCKRSIVANKAMHFTAIDTIAVQSNSDQSILCPITLNWFM